MPADLSALKAHIEEQAGQAFTAAVEETGVEMDVASPYLTGETVESRRITETGGPPVFSAELAYETPQAGFVDAGTAPHEISGNPFLSFNVGGKQIVVRSVQHPGTARTGWFSDNIGPTFEAQIQRQLAALL